MSTEQAPVNTAMKRDDDDTEIHPPAIPFPGRGPDVDASDIILPKWLYIKDRSGRYLTVRSSPKLGTLTFSSGDPNLNSAFECIKTTSPGWFKFISRNGNYITRYYYGWYSADAPQNGPAFNVITSTGNKVYLKDNFAPLCFMSNELSSQGSPLAHDYINDSSQMEINTAAIKNEITDVEYDIDGAKVRDAAPLIALSTSVRNDSDGDSQEALAYTYEKWTAGTWNNTASIEIGATATFQAGVPFVASAEFEISISASYSHEWGGEEGVRQIINSTTTVTVPPKKKAQATVTVRNAQIDIEFTYTQSILWSNGTTETAKKTGIYRNVDSWHVDIMLDNWEDV